MIRVYRAIDDCLDNLEFLACFDTMYEFIESDFYGRCDVVYDVVYNI